MNIINFDCIPPHYHTYATDVSPQYIPVPLFKVIIDGEDIFTDPLDKSVILSDFIFKNGNLQDYCLNGKYLIGLCRCRCEGCADFFVSINTENNITKWIIHPDVPEHAQIKKEFETEKYLREIIKLREYYFSYSWEDYDHKLYRVCNEYIRNFKTKNNQKILEVVFRKNIDESGKVEYNQKMEIYYYGQWKWKLTWKLEFYRDYRSFLVTWNGKTLENALMNLEKFAEKELLKNKKAIKFLVMEYNR